MVKVFGASLDVSALVSLLWVGFAVSLYSADGVHPDVTKAYPKSSFSSVAVDSVAV